ncbi:MAG TPA: MarR family transcriptional regulator [Mycobacteriales bacterium]|jgi:DNA-binding MarR family transcriptional regulator|nr:MarR family transcriptional regulator [Mycobacteriales bacterium]
MTTVDDVERTTRRGATTAQMRRLLRELEHEVTRAMRINLDPAGLSVDEWAVITLLGDGNGHPMSEVIAAAGVPSPTATRIVDRLVSSALLHRAVDPEDRRRVVVVLSPRGTELHARLMPAQSQIAELLASRVGDGELPELMTRLADAVDALRHRS